MVVGRGHGHNEFAYDVAEGQWTHQADNSSGAEGYRSKLLWAGGPDPLLMVGGMDPWGGSDTRTRRALILADDETADDEGGHFAFVHRQLEARRYVSLTIFYMKAYDALLACCF